jgi:drug/metabolite transporter (DMT)-like permease
MANLIIVIYALMSTSGLVLLKLGSAAGAPISFIDGKIHFNIGLITLGGIILYGLSFVIYMYLVSKNDLGYIIPVSTALVYIGIFLASFFIFKEAFTAFKILGIFLIIGGVILLNINK